MPSEGLTSSFLLLLGLTFVLLFVDLRTDGSGFVEKDRLPVSEVVVVVVVIVIIIVVNIVVVHAHLLPEVLILSFLTKCLYSLFYICA